jgi:DNA ligase-associated metallophosphoesterase
MTTSAAIRAPVDVPFAGLDLLLGGEPVRLLAARAVWWPAEHTLLVADVHLGKAESFRALGVPVPAGPTEATLGRLGALVEASGARRMVVLGDLLHARTAQAPATMDALRRWRAARPRLELVLVRGNHDAHAGDPPADLGFRVVPDGHRHGPFVWCHAPAPVEPVAPATTATTAKTASRGAAQPPEGYRLCGHLHPAVRLRGRAREALRLPCFVAGPLEAILPAFGEFTGSAPVGRAAGARVFAVAPGRVFEVPRSARDQ